MPITEPHWTIQLPNEQATKHFGIQLGQWLPAGSILLLSGDLGSGKTTLVQGIGQGLGITEPIVSPTFTLINEYPEGRIPLYHLDLYRLQPAEVGELYLEAYWEGLEYPLGIVAIEWSERLNEPPLDVLQITLKLEGAGRIATLQATGTTHQQILRELVVQLKDESGM